MEMLLLMLCSAEAAVEGEEVQTEHIECRHHRCNDAEQPVDFVLFVCISEDLIFREEAREGRQSRNRQCTDEERKMRDRQGFLQSAHFTDVLFAAHCVDHRSCAEEQQCFEECVRHYVEYTAGECADTKAEEHQSE